MISQTSDFECLFVFRILVIVFISLHFLKNVMFLKGELVVCETTKVGRGVKKFAIYWVDGKVKIHPSHTQAFPEHSSERVFTIYYCIK